MKCPNCDSIIKKSKFCSECGKEIDTGLTETQKKYLKNKKLGHQVGAVTGGLMGGAGFGFGVPILLLGILLTPLNSTFVPKMILTIKTT